MAQQISSLLLHLRPRIYLLVWQSVLPGSARRCREFQRRGWRGRRPNLSLLLLDYFG
jgi:hypothetical protein